MLATVVAHRFSTQSRERGEGIVRSRAVNLTRIAETTAAAIVQGNEAYAVDVDVRQHTAWFGCSCPYASDGNFCKHIWATLLQLDSNTAAHALIIALNSAQLIRLKQPVRPIDEDPQVLFSRTSPSRAAFTVG